MLSPVVQCGPPDLTFAKPLILSLPHCAVIDTPEKWSISIYNSSTPSAEEEMPEWKVRKQHVIEMRNFLADFYQFFISHENQFILDHF